MARSDTITQLPLDSWARIMGLNPYEFNQIGLGFPVTNQAQCPYVWFQAPWQQDFLCRDEVATAILKAEEAIAEELKYQPSPQWFTNEVQVYPRPYNREMYGNGGTPRYQWKAVQLNWGKVQAGGLMARTVINAAVAVVMSDNDGDGVNDRFTVTIATTVTDPDEIAVYFTSADRNGVALDESWRIRPVKVTISGGNAIITGHPSQLIKPDLETITNPAILDVTTAANFVTTVEVDRLYLDTTSTTVDPNQGKAEWDDPDCDTTPCTAAWIPVCLGNRNGEMGLVSVDYSQGGLYCPPVNREPDRVRLNYVAGEPLVNGQMNKNMAEIVAHLATAWLPVGQCGCSGTQRILDYWRGFEGIDSKGAVPYGMREVDENPFGLQRGALYAWNRVQHIRQLWSALV